MSETHSPALPPSEDDLETFGRQIWPSESVATATAINQARFGLSRVLPLLPTAQVSSILEVGAGCMLLSGYLASKGFRISALEPLTLEFQGSVPLQTDVIAFCEEHAITFERIDAFAESYLAPDKYDLIFSIHVLEHTRDPFRVIDNAYANLRHHGSLLAVCPNYDVPFEPHLGILLVGRSKRLNEKLHGRKIAAYRECWNGLSLIGYDDLRRHFSNRGLNFHFRRTIVHDMFVRLGLDRYFFERMPRPIRWVYHVLRHLRLLGILAWVPVRLQTPMEFLVTKSD